MWLRTRGSILALLSAIAGGVAASPAATGGEPKRKVLVELFTSQGCDMCPQAEKILGSLAESDTSIVPIAFHVDYFNDPWKDVFSSPLYSGRQMTYNSLYKRPKNAQYGLYYTPMVMIDGLETVNGRDPDAARATIRAAAARPPAVDLRVGLTIAPDGRSGTAELAVASRSPKAEGRPLMVAVVAREDGVATEVPLGENAGRTLIARHPARLAKFETIELSGKGAIVRRLPIDLDPSWNRGRIRVAAFVQDKKTGEIHQAADLPWVETKTKAAAR